MRVEQNSKYEIEGYPNGIIVNYYPSIKDKWDIFLFFSKGICCLAFSYVVFTPSFKNSNTVFFILLSFFLLIGLYNLFQGVGRILALNRSKLVLDSQLKTLKINHSFISSKEVDFNEIDIIQLTGKIEEISSLSSLPVRRTYCSLDAVNKQGYAESLLIINTTKVLKSSNKEIEHELYLTGKKLAIRIAAQLGKKYLWIGYKSHISNPLSWRKFLESLSQLLFKGKKRR